MTNVEREKLEERLETFDRLSRSIGYADEVIDEIDNRLDVIGESDDPLKTLEVIIAVGNYTRMFTFNKQQATVLKELLDSYRCDVRKRLEEL